ERALEMLRRCVWPVQASRQPPEVVRRRAIEREGNPGDDVVAGLRKQQLVEQRGAVAILKIGAELAQKREAVVPGAPVPELREVVTGQHRKLAPGLVV